ncbi:MAG: DUF3008 family protein [Rhodobacterales bacterium]|nr:DUF3008 family protein [Rhodobacterales bacterium]
MEAKSNEEREAASAALAVKRGEAEVDALNDTARALYVTKTEDELQELSQTSSGDNPDQADG